MIDFTTDNLEHLGQVVCLSSASVSLFVDGLAGGVNALLYVKVAIYTTKLPQEQKTRGLRSFSSSGNCQPSWPVHHLHVNELWLNTFFSRFILFFN